MLCWLQYLILLRTAIHNQMFVGGQGCGREEQLVGRPEQCHRRVQEQESNLCHPRPPQPRPEVRGKGGRCCSSLDSRPASNNVPVVQHRVLSGESATPLSRLR